jgi:predicted RNA-binding Zn-ribbon protein involved in translation (DUF1610 family)
MWLRHALNLLSVFLILSACSPTDRQAADKLNSLSYAYHYSSLDSTEYYAQQVLRLPALCNDGKAEALNHLAFVRIAQMRYEEAEQLLNQIPDITDNQLELLVCYVQQMRLCQRRSHNREFYDFRERAISCMKRIGEERDYPEHDGRYECPDCGNVVYYDELYGGGWTIYVEDYQIPLNHCPNCGKAVKR